ncbi:MAG: M48 family metallopeptidase [Pseudomonadota bacterium]|nr:M48 family metallopeptidase [Pseudomonadota bacterium]
MKQTLEVDGLTFRVARSARRKTIGLSVDRNASLVAHLPENTSTATASEAIRGKLVWVYQKLAEHRSAVNGDVFRRPEFVDGESFYLLGNHYRLKLVDPSPTQKSIPTIRFVGDRLLFRRSQVEAGDKRIAEYYMRAGRRFINDAVARWAPILGVTPAQYVNVMDLGFRWGSCSADGTLNFHWRTMQLPARVIDYIVVHELGHLKVRDHSSAFWQEVGRALPDYPSLRAWLRQKGGEL